MIEICWDQLVKNAESKEINFESFNFQVAYKKYAHYGRFEYDYNTPGSEFYLSLYKDCDELNAKAGDVVGWQAKFWVNNNDMNNTSFNSARRAELLEGIKTSLRYKSNLKTWIICTPGQPTNSQPHCPKDTLVNELHNVAPDMNVDFWNKPIYEAILLGNYEQFSPIFCSYFSQHYIGYNFVSEYSKKRIDLLNAKYDSDLYTEGQFDRILGNIIHIEPAIKEIIELINKLSHEVNGMNNNEFATIRVFKYYSQELMDNLNRLLEYEIELVNALNDKSKQVFEIADLIDIINYIKKEERSIEQLIKTINSELQREQSSTDYNWEEEQYFKKIFDIIHYIREQIIKVEELLVRLISSDIHIFGRAGYGKTNLACSICNKALDTDIPALLFLASEFFSSPTPIKKQFSDSLELDNSIDFGFVLSSLNNIGFLKKVKIPIIIDGLNETRPTASFWRTELFYLIQDIKKYDHLFLITTCRDIYAEQVFKDCTNYKNVSNHIYLDGFNIESIASVINKYFSKYKITVVNKDFDKELFKSPLILKIFSVANRGSSITLTKVNLYQAFDTYINNLIHNISLQDGIENKLFKNCIQERIKAFSQRLWDSNLNFVNYPEDFYGIFDPDYDPKSNIKDTISYKVLDEGMFISRRINNNKEVAEFTYQALGGFCTAKYGLLESKEPYEIVELLNSSQFGEKLFKLNEETSSHPLAEDITNSLIYLVPIYTGKQIFEIVNNDYIVECVVGMLPLITSTKEGKSSLASYSNNIGPESPSNKKICSAIIKEIVNYSINDNLDLLIELIGRYNPPYIDLNWTEAVRENSIVVRQYLYRIGKNINNISGIENVLTFISLLLSSSDRALRDKATKCIATIGKVFADEYFNVFKRLLGIKDLYIIERMLASLVGIVIGQDNDRLVGEIARYLDDTFLSEVKTTHILILDYIDIILNFASNEHGYVKQKLMKLYEQDLPNWEEDIECLKAISKDASWGYGPVHMDFSKYIIGHLDRDYRKQCLSNRLAMVIWKIKQYGYSDALFNEIDRDIVQSKNQNRIDNLKRIERYGKKYSWIAYFELYGHLAIQNLVETEYQNSFRISGVDIDPTFPNKPKKQQLIYNCYLPKDKEDIQGWINEDSSTYLDSAYQICINGTEWVLLRAQLNQQNKQDSRIDIYIHTYFINNDDVASFVELLENKNNSYYLEHPEHFYLFAGEIPWNNKGIKIKESIENTALEIYYPYEWYCWESYHSIMNDIESVPFLSQEFAQYLDLRFNPTDFSFYTKNDEPATLLYWDDYSHFLYLRKDLLQSICKNSNFSILWLEDGTRWGDFGNDNTELNPSFNDFLKINCSRLQDD